MARQNQPTLLNPLDTVRKQTDQSLGIPSTIDTESRLAALERETVQMKRLIERLLMPSAPLAGADMTDILSVLEFIVPGIVRGKAVKGSVTPTAVTSTTGTTITSFNLGPLMKGVPYVVFGVAKVNANADPTGYIFAMIRIVNSGAGVDGEQTGTAAGERALVSPNGLEVVGDGTSINVAVRARVTTGSGSVNDASVWAVGIPMNFAVIT